MYVCIYASICFYAYEKICVNECIPLGRYIYIYLERESYVHLRSLQTRHMYIEISTDNWDVLLPRSCRQK